MRRALVLLAALSASLLLAAPALAPAAPTEPAPEVHDILFELHPEGFDVRVYGLDLAGDQKAVMAVERDRTETVYEVPAELTDHSVDATFGDLGALDFDFGPTPGTRRCRGLLTFTGSLTFAGEGGYVHVEADHARGVAFLGRSSTACPPAGRKQVTVTGLEASLEATAESPGAGTRNVWVDEAQGRDGRRGKVEIRASLVDEEAGMTIAHKVSVDAGPSAFRYDPKAGTATVRPPAPFVGHASLGPGRGGRPAWEGPLRMPVLGGEPVALAGPEFHASLESGSHWERVRSG